MPRTAKDCEGCEYFNITLGLDEQTHFVCYRPNTLDGSALVDDLADLDACPVGYVRSRTDKINHFAELALTLKNAWHIDVNIEYRYSRDDVVKGISIILEDGRLIRDYGKENPVKVIKCLLTAAMAMGFSSFADYAETLTGKRG